MALIINRSTVASASHQQGRAHSQSALKPLSQSNHLKEGDCALSISSHLQAKLCNAEVLKAFQYTGQLNCLDRSESTYWAKAGADMFRTASKLLNVASGSSVYLQFNSHRALCMLAQYDGC